MSESFLIPEEDYDSETGNLVALYHKEMKCIYFRSKRILIVLVFIGDAALPVFTEHARDYFLQRVEIFCFFNCIQPAGIYLLCSLHRSFRAVCRLGLDSTAIIGIKIRTDSYRL